MRRTLQEREPDPDVSKFPCDAFLNAEPDMPALLHIQIGLESGLLVLLVPTVGFANLTTRCLPPDISTPPHQALHSSRWRQSRPNIEVEDGFASWFWRCRVKVDHISDLLLLAIDLTRDEPIVAIKRRFRTRKS